MADISDLSTVASRNVFRGPGAGMVVREVFVVTRMVSTEEQRSRVPTCPRAWRESITAVCKKVGTAAFGK
jgi:hypothetical protein